MTLLNKPDGWNLFSVALLSPLHLLSGNVHQLWEHKNTHTRYACQTSVCQYSYSHVKTKGVSFKMQNHCSLNLSDRREKTDYIETSVFKYTIQTASVSFVISQQLKNCPILSLNLIKAEKLENQCTV